MNTYRSVVSFLNLQSGNFYITLRKFREGRGYTQEEFAEICDISRAYYGRSERGEHSLEVEKCQQIAQAPNVWLADLFAELQD